MRKILLIVSVIILSFSCTKKLDFNQINKLEISPVFEGNLFFVNLNKSNLSDENGSFHNVVKDTIELGIFKNGNNRNAFDKAEIYVNYENSFQRNFETIVFFIDSDKQIVASDTLIINPANPGQTISGEKVYTHKKIINPEFVNFRKIVFKITITPSTSPIEDESLHIKTKGIFYSKININN